MPHTFLLGAVTLLTVHSAHAETIDHIIAKITETRNKIDSYHLNIVQTTSSAGKSGAPNVRKQRLEIWHQGQHTRLDTVILETNQREEAVGQRTVRCRHCEMKDHLLQASHRPGAVTPVDFHPLDSYAPATDPTDCNWPWLGLANNVSWPWFAYPQDHFLKAFLTKGDVRVTPVTETTDVIDGVTCLRFSLSGKTEPRELILWVDPKRDFAPLRMVATEKGAISRLTTFTYPDKPTNRIWFPNRVTQQLGSNAHTTTDYVIEHAEFNRKIDAKTFTYAGLNLPDQIPVMVDGITDVMRAPKLRDGKLVPAELSKGRGSGDVPSATVAIPDHYPSRWWGRVPYLLGALGLAVLGVYCARKMLCPARE